MNKTTYTTNKTGFILWDNRIMSIHNFYIELCGSRMEGTNSLYCHTVGWANLHSFGTKHGSLNDKEIWDLIISVGAKFIKYPSVDEIHIPMHYYNGQMPYDGLTNYEQGFPIGGL